MSISSSDHLSRLSPEQRAQVEDRIEAFERAWSRGEHPAIADHLPDDAEVRAALLVELVQIDREFRAKAGDRKPISSYLGEFPEIADDLAQLASQETVGPSALRDSDAVPRWVRDGC